MKFSLDSMTKQILENASTSTTEDNLNSTKEKLQSTAANEKILQREIWILQTSPQSNECEVFVVLSCYFVVKYLLWKPGLPHVRKCSRKNYFELAKIDILKKVRELPKIEMI